jgi:hypothetical protein
MKRRKHRAKSTQFSGNVSGVNRSFAETDRNPRTNRSIRECPVIWVSIRERDMEVSGIPLEPADKIEPRPSPAGAQVNN